jgi:hypothetical protein
MAKYRIVQGYDNYRKVTIYYVQYEKQTGIFRKKTYWENARYFCLDTKYWFDRIFYSLKEAKDYLDKLTYKEIKKEPKVVYEIEV